MKTGYSLLLGELVPATAVEHADTVGFQICCPECRDPVFKVARTQGDNATVEFFSHHRAPKDVVAECELRVGAIGDAEIASRNAASRGQTLKAFLSVLRDALALDVAMYRPLTPQQSHSVMRSYPKMAWLFEYMEIALVNSELDGFAAMADYYLGSIEQAGMRLETGFSRGIQRRIALDIVEHLRAPHMAKSRSYLIEHVFCYGCTTLANRNELTPFMADVKRLYDLAQDTSPAFERAFDQLQNGTYDGNVGFHLLTYHIQQDVMSCLLRLPYMKMLANHRMGHHMLEGIEIDAGNIFGLIEEVQEGPKP